MFLMSTIKHLKYNSFFVNLFRDPIAPGATIISPEFEVRPYRTPSITLVADFDSNEVSNLKNRFAVPVSYN